MTARVSAIGYLGGPPVIGVVADAVGPTLTFAAVVVLSCAGIVAASRGPGGALPPDAAVHG